MGDRLLLSRFKADQAGAVAPIYAVALTALIAIAGVGFDYSRMASRGLAYGPAYRTVEALQHDGTRARARLHRSGSVIGPELIDGALQIVLGLAPAACGVRSTYVPVAYTLYSVPGAPYWR